MSVTRGDVRLATFVPGLVSYFFILISVVFFGLVLTGFGPSFYFRWLSDAEPLPTYLLVHGVVLTLWFAWLPLQSLLIQTNRRTLHRRLGIAGAAIGYGALATCVVATIRRPAHHVALHGAGDVTGVTVQFWIDAALNVAFAVLLTLALSLRRLPETHKRLMLAAYIAMMPAPVAHTFGAGQSMIPVTLVAMFLSLVGYDLKQRRRLHPATWLSPLLLFGIAGLCGRVIAMSSFGETTVSRLAGLG